jgi:hypothetical protein
MKFNRQKRVTKQLQLAKQRRLKMVRKNAKIASYATISILANFSASNVKNEKLKNALQFISALSGAMFINSLSAANHKAKNVKTIDVVPVNIKECINKYLPKTQTNNYESLQISPQPQTL